MDFAHYIKEHKKKLVIFCLLLFVFLTPRLLGTSLPYHQDEWKNVSASRSVATAGAFFAHPPLMQMIFVASNFILGDQNMRLLPLFFSVASIVLLYIVVSRRIGERAALWSALLFAFCFYNILGSLSPDVDGAILPFFFLLSVYAYDRKLLPLLTISLLIGLLVKLSFILVVGTILVDYLWQERKVLNTKKIFFSSLALLAFGALYMAILYFIKAVYPAFDMNIMLGHANQYTGELGRNWIQIIVQGVKSLQYLSPLLLVPLLFINKDIFKKTRIFFVYLLLGLIFYFVLFDFSRAALDKYLMFTILPLSVICGAILANIFNSESNISNKQKTFSVLFGFALAFLLFTLNFLTHSIPSLYPKTEWFSKVAHLQWNILNPFHGGSGPLGFYVSFLFIATSFIASILLGLIGYFKKEWRFQVSITLIIVGLSYNIFFAEELLVGRVNGSAPKVLREATSFINGNSKIKEVITYNDIGGYELSKEKKYAGRIYATPESEDGYRKKFAEYTKNKIGYFLVVDIPRINPKSFYGQYFASCQTEFQSKSGEIEAKVYSCR